MTRLAVWSPLPPSASGIADYAAEQLPELARHFEVDAVVEDPRAVNAGVAAGVALRAASAAAHADLDLYQLGNSPAHAWVYRAALARPGVLLLHDFNLHHLVLAETVERGDVAGYLDEMRRAHGEEGSFVGRQVSRALGGDLLPALYPLNDRVLAASLAVVGLTRESAEGAARRLPGRPVLHLPHHLSLPLDPPPTRSAARAALGIPHDALVLTAPGLATASKRLDAAIRAVARLRPKFTSLRLVVAGDVDQRLPLADWARDAGVGSALTVTGRLAADDFVRHLAAADVVLCLRFPSHGEISGALVRTLGVGRPALVTAGTPAHEEFPEGIVVPVDPGRREPDELEALLARLLGDQALRESLGRLAREHVLAHHDLGVTTRRLAGFLSEVHALQPTLLAAIAEERDDQGTRLGLFVEETRRAARELGLSAVRLGVRPLFAGIAGERR
jgi:glycosyltransferase involved in cell wall biosynthesis